MRSSKVLVGVQELMRNNLKEVSVVLVAVALRLP